MGSRIQMDWIDEKIEKIRKWIQNLPLKYALAAYLILALLASFVCSWLLRQACFLECSRIFRQYGVELYQEGRMGAVFLAGQNAEIWRLTEAEQSAVKLLSVLSDLLPWVITAGGMTAASFLFYRNRMKRPFRILEKGVDEIARKNLDFQIRSDSRDEMGQLCDTFDRMRKEVIREREELWRRIEDQKEINTAFAHDLRTPLTVLRGYSELLGRYVPEGKISEEKLSSTLDLMTQHLKRLENYTRTMGRIRSFEEIEPKKQPVSFSHLTDRLHEITDPLDGAGDIRIVLDPEWKRTSGKEECRPLWLDEMLFLEVFENLLSNALRYARTFIRIALDYDEEEGFLVLSVQDDGQGFDSTEIHCAAEPYFRGGSSSREQTDPAEEREHFGIGLHSCRVLAKKHGGCLNLANSMDGGAFISISFFCRKS